jgi:cephalosporin hydroxylase
VKLPFGRRRPAEGGAVTEEFHRLYYDSEVWKQTYWLGVPVQKCPLDLWLYQEILAEIRPHLIVETGTLRGGSALFLASICDLLGHGHVVTVDIRPQDGRPRHPRISYLTGSSTDPTVVSQVRARVAPDDRVLVILDSDHTEAHVLGELQAYGPLVTLGSYMIVEDTNINGHPVLPRFGPGPMEAVRRFLATTTDFVADPRGERLFVTFNPGGWLRRVR